MTNVRSLDEYRSSDSEAVLLCALDTVRTEGADGLVLCLKPRGSQAVRAWATGEYSRHPAKAKQLLSRVWEQLASEEQTGPAPITVSARL